MPSRQMGTPTNQDAGQAGVATCLVWPKEKNNDEFPSYSDDKPSANRYLAPKADIGKARTRNYVMTQRDTQTGRDEGGRVIEALRGWPGEGLSGISDVEAAADGRDTYQGGFYNPEMYDDPTLVDMFADVHLSKKSSAKPMQSGKGRGKKGKGKTEPEDPYDAPMGDLIAHRYMREAAEREAARKLAEEQAKREQVKQRMSARKNRTSQLRQIAIDNKVLAVKKNPNDLWKMSKFQQVPPHLDTFKGRRPPKETNSVNFQEDIDVDQRRSNGGSPIVQRSFSHLSNTTPKPGGGPPHYGNSPDVTNAAGNYNPVSSGHDDHDCYAENYDNPYRQEVDLFDPDVGL